MKVTKITFEQCFPTGQYANQRLAIEIDVSDSSPSDIVSHYQYAMDKVNSAFNALNPHLYEGGEVEKGKVEEAKYKSFAPEEKPITIDTIIADLQSVTAIDEKNSIGAQVGLLSFQQYTANPRINEAYQLKLKELQG